MVGFFQILVEAYDSAFPDDVVSEVVVFDVLRNNYGPRFSLTTYTANINDFDPAGTFVGTVTATDQDSQVGCTFESSRFVWAFERVCVYIRICVYVRMRIYVCL